MRKKRKLKVQVIHLPSSVSRKKTFTALNEKTGLNFVFSKGVDSKKLDINALREKKLVRPGTLFRTPGCSLAHRNLWIKCSESKKPLIICEDDAVFRMDFHRQFVSCIKVLPPDWDFALLGYNLDSMLEVEVIPGVERFTAEFTNTKLGIRELESFQTSTLPVAVMPLRHSFGLPGYALSPKGARFLLSNVFPLHNCPVMVKGQSHLAFALDALMNGMYEEMKAFVCVPPLVVSPNEADPSAQIMRVH